MTSSGVTISSIITFSGIERSSSFSTVTVITRSASELLLSDESAMGDDVTGTVTRLGLVGDNGLAGSAGFTGDLGVLDVTAFRGESEAGLVSPFCF